MIRRNKGITLIALVITIILMLILVGIVIRLAFNGGLFNYAGNAVSDTKKSIEDEKELTDGYFQVGGRTIDEWVENTGDGKGLVVEFSKTNGDNLWSSTITFNLKNELTLEEKKQVLVELYECEDYDDFLYNCYGYENENEYREDIENYYDGDENNFLIDVIECENGSIYNDFFTLEQKKEIAAYLLQFPDYTSLKSWMDSKSWLSSFGMNETQFIDYVIEEDSKFINYNDVENLKSLGIVVYKITTPTNTLYTTNLVGTINYSVNKNGNYYFKIECNGEVKSQKIKIDNIRNKNTSAPYSVKIEQLTNKLEYSLDGTTWQNLGNEAIVQTNNKLYLRFNTVPHGSTGYGIHYVDKNDEFYKYYNDAEQEEWVTFRSDYLINSILFDITHVGNPLSMRVLSAQNISKNYYPSYYRRFNRYTRDFLSDAIELYGTSLWQAYL